MAAPQLDVRDPLEPQPLIEGQHTDKTTRLVAPG